MMSEGRVLMNAVSGLEANEHRRHRDDHRGHHDVELVDHADRGDDRVEREHRVEHHDLRHDRPEGRMRRAGRLAAVPALDPVVDLGGRLDQQEHAAGDQDQVAPGDLEAPEREHRRGERHHPGDARQQREPHDQRERQADDARAVALLRRQLVGQDGDEDQVVDPQHDLEGDQREKPDPDGRISDPFHDLLPSGQRTSATTRAHAATTATMPTAPPSHSSRTRLSSMRRTSSAFWSASALISSEDASIWA